MSTTPEPAPAAESTAEPAPAADTPEAAEGPAGDEATAPEAPAPAPEAAPDPAPAPSAARRRAALIFDDPLSRQSSDDTDRGWGERPTTSAADRAADLARFLDEKPPHHL